jgi:hypothetical protein
MGRVFTLIVILSLALSATAAADQPLQEWRHIDVTAKAVAASQICGFDIFRHFEGDSHFVVFYDHNGAITREVDTFPGLTITLYAPSTGQSYTSSSPAVLHTYYTNGAAIGSEATGILTGLVEKFGSADLDSGRLVFLAHVTGYDAAGVPNIRFFEEVSSVGPNVDVSVPQSRCDGVRSQ